MNFRNFFYNKNAGYENIKITNESFLHIVKARRKKENDIVILKNLKDDFDYFYKIVKVEKKKATAVLEKKQKIESVYKNDFHLGLCVIDPKSIKEVLPYLNQTGLEKITFIYSDLSQKSFKLNTEKIEKILINSSEQCGRNKLMKVDFKNSIDDFLKDNKESFVLNFGGEKIDSLEKEKIKTCIVGPEGGFSEREMELFKKDKILSFSSESVLKAENASVCLCAKILL